MITAFRKHAQLLKDILLGSGHRILKIYLCFIMLTGE
jgi:hypothetical protein